MAAACDDDLMKLGSGDGDILELLIEGYQFPEAQNPQMRFSWHMISGRATTASGSWPFRWQALTCDESVHLGTWLQEVADRSNPNGPRFESRPHAISFTEPNLRFEAATSSPSGSTIITAQLDLEFRAPNNRNRRSPGEPNTLQLHVTQEQISAAATEWAANLAQYPDELATDH